MNFNGKVQIEAIYRIRLTDPYFDVYLGADCKVTVRSSCDAVLHGIQGRDLAETTSKS